MGIQNDIRFGGSLAKLYRRGIPQKNSSLEYVPPEEFEQNLGNQNVERPLEIY
jgi:hypothetical protein